MTTLSVIKELKAYVWYRLVSESQAGIRHSHQWRDDSAVHVDSCRFGDTCYRNALACTLHPHIHNPHAAHRPVWNFFTFSATSLVRVRLLLAYNNKWFIYNKSRFRGL